MLKGDNLHIKIFTIAANGNILEQKAEFPLKKLKKPKFLKMNIASLYAILYLNLTSLV